MTPRMPRQADAPDRSARAVRRELTAIPRLAVPAVLAQIGWVAMGLVDMLFVGRLGPGALAAVALGDVWVFATLLVGLGVLMGLDPIATQAHGARDARRLGLALQRSIVIALALSVPMTGLFFVAAPGLRLLGQDPDIAREAGAYVLSQVFCVAPYLVFAALRQYLHARGLMYPGLIAVLVANVGNVFMDWLLIFGHWGFPALGVVGSGIATGIARVLILLVVLLVVWRDHLLRDGWVPWDRRAALHLAGLWEILRHGIPVAAQMALEVWAFSASGLFAGWLGAEALAAHTITLKLASLSYMVPLGISIACATRVGNLVGARDLPAARVAAWTGFALGAGVMAFNGMLFVALRGVLPRLFVDAPAVLAAAATILPIAAAFQLFDGMQVVAAGALRGMGATRSPAVANFVGYYLLGLPLGLLVAFGGVLPGGLASGLPGLWLGLAAGLAAVAAILAFGVRARLAAMMSEEDRKHPAPAAACDTPAEAGPRSR